MSDQVGNQNVGFLTTRLNYIVNFFQLHQLDFSGEDIIASHNSRQYLEMNDVRRAFFFVSLCLCLKLGVKILEYIEWEN